MKRIGECIGDNTWTTTLAGINAMLYVSDHPRDQGQSVSERYKIKGWILPGDAENGGGAIYDSLVEAGRNGVAAYTRRIGVTQPAPAPDPISAMSAAEERITALEKAFVMLTSQSADIIEAQRSSIAQLQKQVREAFDYCKSLEKTMRSITGSGAEMEFRQQAMLAALPGLCARWDLSGTDDAAGNAIKHAYLIADAVIAAETSTVPTHKD